MCLVGMLNFLTHARPDLAFTVQALSQYIQNPTEAHNQDLHHTLHYIANTSGQGIILKGSDHLRLHAYFDSDWGHVWTPENQSRDISFLLIILLLVGNPRNNKPYPSPRLKLNTA